VGGSFNAVSPHSGNFQAIFLGGANTLTQSLTTTPGASYVVDFWLASSVASGTTEQAVVFWGGFTTIFNHLFTSSSGYTEYTFNVTASTATTVLAFKSVNGGFGMGNNLFLDDDSVTPAGVPDAGSTVSLLGCALLGLTALRRKLSC